jgi:hypothetical protein
MFLVAFGIPAGACAAMFAAVEVVRMFSAPIPESVAVALQIGFGALSYMIVAATIDRFSGSVLAASLRSLIRSR